MSLKFDATLKEIVGDDAARLRPAFRLPNIEPARTLNVDLSTLSAATDVAFGFDEPIQEITDLNFQSGPDPHLPARLHLYKAAFHFHMQAPVQSILVLLRPKADGRNLTGKLEYDCGGKRVLFEYDIVWMWEQPIETFLNGGPNLLPLASLCKLPEGIDTVEAVRNLISEVDARFNQMADRATAAKLMRGALVLAGLRVEKTELPHVIAGVRYMTESTAFDYWMEEGEKRGLLRQGHHFLLLLGKKRFGKADAATEAQLNSITDLDRLDRMAEAVLSAADWRELLETP